MANFMSIKGTTQESFQIGAGNGKYPFTLDASGFTSTHLWKLPDSDGTSGYTLSTDGAGNLSWSAPGVSTPYVPIIINSGNTFTIPTNTQILFAEPLTVVGDLVVDGDLIDVANQIIPMVGGSSHQVQRNEGGAFYANANLTFEEGVGGTSNELSILNGSSIKIGKTTDFAYLKTPDNTTGDKTNLNISSGSISNTSTGYTTEANISIIAGQIQNVLTPIGGSVDIFAGNASSGANTTSLDILGGRFNFIAGDASSIGDIGFSQDVQGGNFKMNGGFADNRYGRADNSVRAGNFELYGGLAQNLAGATNVCAGGNFILSGGNSHGGWTEFGPFTSAQASGGDITIKGGTADSASTNTGGNIILQSGGANTGDINNQGKIIITTDGGLQLNGTLGTAGQVFTSNGSAQPTWTTISSGVTTVTASAPLSSTGGATPDISISLATTSTDGYLSSTDWNTFNGKQNALGYTPYNATNPAGYISGISGSDVTTALGYTPYNATNPAGYTTNTGTVTSVSGTGTVSGLTLSGTVTTSGNLTLGGTLSLTSADITTGLGYTPYNATNPSGYTTNLGTVTSVSVTTANGVSGSVATATTTPAITLTLGAITPSSVAASGTVTGSNLSGTHSGSSSGTNTGDQTLNSLLPTQTGNSGKYLTTDGTNSSWATVSALTNAQTLQLLQLDMQSILLSRSYQSAPF